MEEVFVNRKFKGKKKRRYQNNKENAEQISDNSDKEKEFDEDLNSELEDVNDNEAIQMDSILKTNSEISGLATHENEPVGNEDREEQTQKTTEENEELKTEELVCNHRALSSDALTYELEKFEKKLLIIFNQENVNGYERRTGTDQDALSLTITFEKFGFEVKVYKDKTKEEIFQLLKDFNTRDFTDFGCVGIAVLTHGTDYGLLQAKDYAYSEMEIIDHFKVHNKPTLVTKPKFLIIQACRGLNIIPGARVHQAQKIHPDIDASTRPYYVPVEADMFIVHSSFHGTPSHRWHSGSWFIQALCKKINLLAAELDFLNIICEVQRTVAIECQYEVTIKGTQQKEMRKQMPVTTNTLTRKLYLRRFNESSLLPVDVDGSDNTNNNETRDDNISPSTSLRNQSGPCSCFEEHFKYIMKCLRFYVKDNPSDSPACSFLDIGNALDNDNLDARHAVAKAVSEHLYNTARDHPYYKFLYFYGQKET